MRNTLKLPLTAAAAACVLAGVTATESAAVTVTNHVGDPVGTTRTYSATAGTSRLVVNGSVALNCTNTGGTTSVTMGVYTFPTTPGTTTPTFSGCVGPLGLTFTVVCPPGAASLNLISGPTGGTTEATLSGISCTVSLPLIGCSATVAGSVNGSYTNPTPTPAPGTTGRITVYTAGQSLTVSGSGCPAVIPNGSAQFGAPAGGGLGLTNINYFTAGPTNVQPIVLP